MVGHSTLTGSSKTKLASSTMTFELKQVIASGGPAPVFIGSSLGSKSASVAELVLSKGHRTSFHFLVRCLPFAALV